MQTIVWKENNVSIYLHENSKTITISEEDTKIFDGNTLERVILDVNSNNATLHTGVDEKTTWWGYRYKYDGSTWSDNADFKGSNNTTSNINNSVTTIPVNNSNAFTTSGTILIGSEQITYTGIDGNNLTGCTRGANSTSAASYNVGQILDQI